MRDDVEALYQRYRSRPQNGSRGKIIFRGVDGLDVYNPTAPFMDEGRWCIAARVERRDSEDSRVRFFLWDGDCHAELLDGMPDFALQDPFVSQVSGQLLFGGVEVDFSTKRGAVRWRTQFFAGPSVSALRPLTTGPWGMKDIRLVELPDKRILVFTRPQGEPGGHGTIGWTIVSRLADLNEESIASATLLSHVEEQYWCGVNEACVLSPGLVGVLAHVARFDEFGNRHYHAARFLFDYQRGISSPMAIIACREDFLAGESKRSDLQDVVFPAGLLAGKSGRRLFCGTSDCEVQWLDIADPFTEEA
ncbi:TPA: DUF1861 family protein [Kluyvera georgiana]|uniref:DUF1861 family protein n=1 Tax=Kluyvera georgiana ATCC 51603 TaxID=1354264 RepID=A0A1B7K6E6_9ENTR|nr:DUF1861 family protein [Kluyvera georgiana]OAT55726.1 hypothetical protein M989_00747 [Kluyvera georgiana ATCC 51603]